MSKIENFINTIKVNNDALPFTLKENRQALRAVKSNLLTTQFDIAMVIIWLRKIIKNLSKNNRKANNYLIKYLKTYLKNTSEGCYDPLVHKIVIYYYEWEIARLSVEVANLREAKGDQNEGK